LTAFIDAYTSWEWSTLCDEISKLKVDLRPTKLGVLPLAKREIPEKTPVSGQVFASDFATRDQSEMISSATAPIFGPPSPRRSRAATTGTPRSTSASCDVVATVHEQSGHRATDRTLKTRRHPARPLGI
jgi:hypothetical protein